MKPGLCGATFHDEADGLDHRCFQPLDDHPPRHYCICLDRGLAFGKYGPHYYDRDGRPIPMCAWAILFEDREEYGRVKATTVGLWWISTVWLGMDHAYGGGPPLIFESMVFWHGPDGAERDDDRPQYRYSTEAEARAGHARLVRECRRHEKAMPTPPEVNVEPL